MVGEKRIVIIGVVFCLTAVILGAFTAHALKEILESSSIKSFNTGVRYQFWHGLALLCLATWNRIFSIKKLSLGLLFIAVGTMLFSGSIYLLALKSILAVPTQFIGPITPIGGMLIILGWVIILIKISMHNFKSA